MKVPRNWIILAITALGPVLLFGPMLLRGRVLYWGTPILQFVPWHDFALDVFRRGNFPFWNPLLGFGAPLFANYQSALLYPPNFLLAVAGPAYGHGLLVALHLIWAGIGMALLVRRLELPIRSQLVAGIAFSLSGFMVARAWFISINHAAAWLPWITLAIDKLAGSSEEPVGERRWMGIVYLGVLFSLQWLAGHAQTSWYTLVFAIAWLAWRSVQRRGWGSLLQSSVNLVLAGMLGLVLSAIQLVPAAEYLLQSQRAGGLEKEFALTYSFWPWRLAGLLAPDLFGNPSAGTYWGYGNYWEDAIYIGVFPLLMAMASMARFFRRRHPERATLRLLTGVSLIAFLFALGKNTFVFRFLFEHIPTFDLFQAPSRWNILFVFCLSILAGFGVKGWKTPEGRGLYWTRLGTAGAGIIGIASYIGASYLGDVQATFVPAFARAGLLLCISGLLTLFLNKKDDWLVVLGLSGFILLDLVTAGTGLNPTAEAAVFQGQSQLARIVRGSERVYMPLEIEEQLKFEETHRFDTFFPGIDWETVRDVGLPNTTLLDGVYSANNFDPFTPQRYARWMEWLDGLPHDQRKEIFRWTGVRWQAERSEEGVLGVAYREMDHGSRVWMIPTASSVASSEAVLNRLSDPSFDFREELLIEPSPDPNSEGGNGSAVIAPQSNPNVVRVEVSSDRGSWLLLTDTWYPGWQVFIDGNITKLYRANYLFMSVWVSAGEHTVEFRYRPSWFGAAAIMSTLGWAAVIAFWLKARSR